MDSKFSFSEVVVAFLVGILLTALGFSAFGGNNTTVVQPAAAPKITVTVPKDAIKVNVTLPKAKTAVNPPAYVPPASDNTTFNVCNLAPAVAYTDTGSPVVLTPEDDSEPSSDCLTTDSGDNYSADVFLQSDVTYSDYQDSMEYDNSPQVGTTYSSPVTPINIAAPGVIAAYFVTGTYTDGSPFNNIVMLVNASGMTYMVTVDVAETFDYTPTLNATNLATTVASNLS